MKKYLTYQNLLWGILILALALRIWGAGNQDLFGDEAPDAFRAIGYLDFLGTSFQTQLVDWYKNQALPWWGGLSFHDLPPLGILIMNFFFRLFGDSIWIARLPAIVLGVISVYLVYLLVKKLFANETAALFSALFFAVNGALVWVFRTSMLEPLLLFFIILNIYCFFQFVENRRRWWLFGLTLGLVALTKYTGIFLLPVYFFYLILNPPARLLFRNWRLYAALGFALLLFSPVIVYNFYLYQAVGHFDLQLAYLFGQETPEWTGLAGKVQSPFSDLWRNLTFQQLDRGTGLAWPVGYYGILAVIVALGGLIRSIFVFKQKRLPGILFFWLYLIFLTLLLVKIGSAHRFLALYGPAFAILVGFWAAHLWEWRKDGAGLPIFKIAIAVFFIWEMIHAVNVNFISMPDYGMAKLDHYFEEEFAGKRSAVIPESDNSHLNKVIHEFASRKSKISDRQFWLIVYNDNVALPTLEWVFYRRFFYHNMPALFVENFTKVVNERGLEYFDGFRIYFVQSTDQTLLNSFKADKKAGEEFERYLQSRGLQPAKIIEGSDSRTMFRVYKFLISDII
ncbi:MAG: glycosyltransferase family 39 protein [bacterium]|nr:glycosyltransferase family 39 protein [bacterium]